MDFRRLFDILPYQQARYPQKVAFSYQRAHRWISYSTAEALAMSRRISAGWLDRGLQRGDRVAIMTEQGTPWWHFIDFSLQQIGAVVVPIHATVDPSELSYILRDCQAVCCVVSNREMHDRVSVLRGDILSLKEVFTIEKLPDLPCIDKLVVEPNEKHLETLQTMQAVIHEDDLATLIYTSGTTGEPKGVMLSHKNIVSNIKSVIALIPVNCDKRVFSFLPLSHVFERMVTYTYMAVGASLYYAAAREDFLNNLRWVRPHYFTTVPRTLEKMYDDIMSRAAARPVFIRRIIFWAIRIGVRYEGSRRVSPLYWLQRRLADLLVYQFWRRALGGKVEGIVVGAAAMPPRLGRLFSAAGVEVREGYGLTETSPVVAFNRFEPGGVRFGTVGIPVPGVEVRIDAPDADTPGEILVKGPNVMMGYYGQEAATQAVMTADGWFRTGDVGRFVHKRFLQITGRQKDIFKTTTGKYVAPLFVETHLKQSPFIEQCMVIGVNRPFVSALILPFFPVLKKWCEENNVHWTAPQFMVINPKVEQKMAEVVAALNEELASHLRVRRYTLIYEEWTEMGGQLTPTLKNRRHRIEAQHQKEIDAMYTAEKG